MHLLQILIDFFSNRAFKHVSSLKGIKVGSQYF